MVTASKKKPNKGTPLDDCPDWTFELLEKYQTEIARVAKHYRLDTYVNQIEVITAEQMMDLKFTLNCAVFQTNNPVTAELKSDLLKLKSDKASSSDTEETVKLGDNPFRVIDKSLTLPILRVYHPNHGYITGNNVTINGAIAQGSLDHINGTYSIGKYETDYYQITGTNALINVLPLKDSNFGGSSVTVGKKLPCDILHPIVSIMDFDETTISTGLSGSEVQLNSDIVLSERKYISPANLFHD